MKAVFSLLTLIFAPALVFAAGSEHSSGAYPGGVPFVVVYQAINVVILFGGLFYFMKEPVILLFANRKSQYLAAATKAQTIRQQAEQDHSEIKSKLASLESSTEQSLAQAKQDAANMKTQMLAEAEALSKRIREEAKLAAQLEFERAKNKLREDVLRASFEAARASLGSKVSTDEHRRLEGEFLNKIQEGRQ